jgi:hypothetical protein
LYLKNAARLRLKAKAQCGRGFWWEYCHKRKKLVGELPNGGVDLLHGNLCSGQQFSDGMKKYVHTHRKIFTRIVAVWQCFLVLGCAVVIFSASLWAQPGYDDFPVERFTREQGYNPDVEPLCFLQDKKGVMWIGASDGLYRYDGTFRRYAHEAGNPFSLPKNRVTALYEDKENVLWVAVSNGGLVCFDRERERFTQYSARAGDSSSLPVAYKYSIIEDAGGRFWLTVDSAIVRFDRLSGKVARRYPLKVANLQSLALDGSGRLWVATGDNFLYRYEERSDSFARAPFELPFTANIVTGVGDTLCVANIDKKGVYTVNVREGRVVGEFLKEEEFDPECFHFVAPDRVWVGGHDMGGGYALFAIDLHAGVARPRGKRQAQRRSDPSNLGGGIFHVYEDRSGVVWLIDRGAVSNAKTDLGKHAPYKVRFKTYRHNPSDSNSLSGNYVRALLADHKNNLWVYVQTEGLDGGVLNGINRSSGEVKRHYPNPRKSGGLAEGVGTLYQDRTGTLWVGTSDLQIFEPDRPARGFRSLGFRTRGFRPISPINALGGYFIISLTADRAGNLWIGTQHEGLWRLPANPGKDGKYLPLRDPKTGKTYPFGHIHENDCGKRLAARQLLRHFGRRCGTTLDKHGQRLMFVEPQNGRNTALRH